MATLVFVVHSTAWITAAVLMWACVIGASRCRAENCKKRHALAATPPEFTVAADRQNTPPTGSMLQGEAGSTFTFSKAIDKSRDWSHTW
jgi:hypothetical protein